MQPPHQFSSEQDFDQLPPALRRKYFSSLERLRLTCARDATRHHGGYPNSKSWSQPSRRASTSSCSFLKKQILLSTSLTHHDLSVASTPLSRTRRTRLQKAARHSISPFTTLVNPSDFAALPAAIRRKHFSLHEQYLIASRVNRVILDAADEALYKQYQQCTRPTTAHSSDLQVGDTEDGESVQEEHIEDMDIRDLESFKWLNNDDNLDLRLDDYHTINADLNKAEGTLLNRRSFRRGLSFSNVSFRRRSSSSTSLQSPPTLVSSRNQSAAITSLSLPRARHQSRDSMSSIDPSATHYQDPAAKLKLRVYLASPQKFDEALEFGFPSMHKDAVHYSTRPKTSSGLVNEQPKTFLADDTPSLSEDEMSDYPCQDSPRTPIDPAWPSHKFSIERSSHVRPRIVRESTETYAHASASDREMTLRMTLTRPELRALEETDHHAKPTTVNDTPLERAPLNGPVGNARSIWDELPEEGSRLKRFFQKLKGRI